MRLLFLTFIVLLIFGEKTANAQVSFSARPSSLQLYPRDANDSALVNFSGVITTTGFSSAVFTMHKNGVLIDSIIAPLTYDNGNASFYYSRSIHAEKSHHRFKMYLVNNSIASLVYRVDSVCSGDAYLINGQSNATSIPNGPGSEPLYLWVRSFGTQSNSDTACEADTSWGLGNGANGNSHVSIGVWALRLGKMLADSSGIPVCIINGSRTGSRVIDHLPKVNHADLTSYYGRLLYRANKAAISQKAKALFWYQGESDTDTAYLLYASRFNQLHNAWKQDYNSQLKIVVVQTRPGCIITQSTIYHQQTREILRTFASIYPDVTLMTTVGLPNFDGCHFTTVGYQNFAQHLYSKLCDDFINKPAIPESDPPNILSAYYSKSDKTELSLIFDQEVLWPANINGYDLKDYIYLNGTATVMSGSSSGDTIKLQLSASSSATNITYLPGIFYAGTTNEYQGPWLLNSRNIGVPSFYQFNISENVSISAGSSTSLCQSDSMYLTTTSVGSSYQWFVDGVLISGANDQSFYAKTPGQYTLNVTTANNVTITSNAIAIVYGNANKPVINSTNNLTSFCNGGNLSLNCNSGAAWLWITGDTSSSITISAPGNYTVQITEQNGCTAVSDPITITVINLAKPVITADKQNLCAGDSIRLSINSNANPVWNNGVAQQSIYIHDSNEYSVTITDNIGCTASSDTISFIVHSLPTVSINATSLQACSGQSITLSSGSSASSYLWSTGQTTAGINVNTNGNYSLTITDQYGCVGIASSVPVNFYIPSKPLITAGKTILCAGQSTVLGIDSNSNNNGVQWLWNNGQTTSTITTGTQGNYTVTITEANGCTAVSDPFTITVINLAKPVITADKPNLCAGDSIRLSTNSNANPIWNNGVAQQFIYIKDNNNYSVSISNNGCSASSDTVSFAIHALPNAFISAPTLQACTGQSIAISSGNVASTYLWTTGQTTATINVNTNGNYGLTVTDQYGCRGIASSVTATFSSPVVTINPAGTVTICSGANQLLNGVCNSSSGTYQWYNNDIAISNATASIYNTTAAGTYKVIYTGNGCSTTSANTIIKTSSLPTSTFTISNQFDNCQDVIVTLTANTGTGLSYQWQKNMINIPGATNRVFVTSSSGSYRVITTNAAGCTKAATAKAIPVAGAPLPSASFTLSNQFDICQDTVVTLTGNSGTGLTYQWQKNTVDIPGATNRIYVTSTSGSYRVETFNTAGCSKASTAKVIPVVNTPSAIITASGPLTFCQGGNVTLTANSGSGYAYQWFNTSSITGATHQSYVANTAASYRVRVTNNAGCTKFSSFVKVTVNNCARENETISERDFSDLVIYPQPFTSDFILSFSNSKINSDNFYFEMYNLSGALVIQSKKIVFNNGEAIIDAGWLTPGIYFYKLTNEKTVYNGRVVKE